MAVRPVVSLLHMVDMHMTAMAAKPNGLRSALDTALYLTQTHHVYSQS